MHYESWVLRFLAISLEASPLADALLIPRLSRLPEAWAGVARQAVVAASKGSLALADYFADHPSKFSQVSLQSIRNSGTGPVDAELLRLLANLNEHSAAARVARQEVLGRCFILTLVWMGLMMETYGLIRIGAFSGAAEALLICLFACAGFAVSLYSKTRPYSQSPFDLILRKWTTQNLLARLHEELRSPLSEGSSLERALLLASEKLGRPDVIAQFQSRHLVAWTNSRLWLEQLVLLYAYGGLLITSLLLVLDLLSRSYSS